MTTTATATRIDRLEEQVRRTEERLCRLELAAVPERRAPQRLPSASIVAPPLVPSTASASAARSPTWTMRAGAVAARPSLEEVLGGRVLAWVGGAAVLVGLALLFALGISNGWIGEGARCAVVATACAGLLGVGVRLHELAGRTEAARTAVATALCGLFLTLVVATAQYALLPEPVGLALATVIGASAVALAVRWQAPVIAALGVVGALLAPAFAGQVGATGGLGFLAVAAVAATAVLTWQRWTWVSVCVALTVTPQWLGWLGSERSARAVILVLAGFGLVQALTAVGTAARAGHGRLAGTPATLLAVNALVLGLAGWFALLEDGTRRDAQLWLAGLALVHLALGAALRRAPRRSGDLGLLCLALGVVLTDVAFALGTHGAAQALGWAVTAVAFAGLARLAHTTGEDGSWDGVAAASGLGLHVALAVLSAAQAFEPTTLLADGVPDMAATTALAALAGACLVSARLAPAHRLVLDVLGLAAAAALTALALDGVALTAAWALEAAALSSLGARGDGDRVAWFAGLAHLAGALAWCLVDQASPAGLAEGVPALGVAVLGLGAVLGAAVRLALLADEEDRPLVAGAVAVGALYLASLVVVDLGGADARGAQLRLSGLWATAGVAALLAGLRRDVESVRSGALALLALTVGKVFVYDLATQEATYRVASFLGLGVLLLGAAFSYQRLHPEAPRDLREVPSALR